LATYLVKAGVHQGNFQIEPKSGDTFCGEPGAVADNGANLSTRSISFTRNTIQSASCEL
jgi:hypothetical protein